MSHIIGPVVIKTTCSVLNRWSLNTSIPPTSTGFTDQLTESESELEHIIIIIRTHQKVQFVVPQDHVNSMSLIRN